ncbi:MAG: GIY-YIG nuclease family protein [Crocinitomicaceae bacterium]|nr:GIY-YIG nuclease family protein [Crocinitomicaceae bacterium]
MYITYILFQKQNKFYIGSTGDELQERIRKHNSNHPGFTGGTGDWELVYSEVFESVQDARQRESQIKKWKSRKMIEKLVSAELVQSIPT